MKILSNKKTDTNTVELEIKVGAERLQKAMDAVFEKQKGDIAIPGFRKGKATRKMVEGRMGAGVFMEDAINEAYPEAYSEAIKEAELDPVAPGDVEILTADPSDGFTMKAIVTVMPKIKVTNYKGIEADEIVKEITEEDVDKEIDQLRERGARLVEVHDRPAQDGDTSIIDFEGFVNEAAFEGGKGENHELVLGSGSFIPGFEEQIIGKGVGDSFDVTVTFPEEYHSDDLAGAEAVFKVTLHELKAKELPQLDDEFAIDVSEFDTLEQLRADFKKNLEEMAKKTAEEATENQLVDKVIENIEGEIPEIMYEVRIDQMVQDFAQRLSSQGMNLELYLQYTGMQMEDFRKTFKAQAERQVKINLALEKIVELEEIKPSEEELEAEYKKMAEMYEMEEDKIKEIIPKEHISEDVSKNKAIDLIRDNAKITQKTEEDAKPEKKDETEE